MKNLILAAFVSILSLMPVPGRAGGVPTFDGTQLTQLVKQLEHMAKDLNTQLQQLATMKQELETQIQQLFNLEAQLRSLIEGSGLGELFATISEFERLKGNLLAPIETARSIASGDFLSAFKPGSGLERQVRRVLSGVGFSARTLADLSASPKPADNRLATQAGASAMLTVAAEESHKAAGESLDRLETMVGLIDDQDGLKAAVDLNTRITAELGIIMTQIWRLEAVQGVSAGQLGVVDAATLAAERRFRTMSVEE
jgi:type IV secretion system protein VirB5